MSKALVYDIGAGEKVTRDLTAGEQANYDALQTITVAQIAAETQATADRSTARNAVANIIQDAVGVAWTSLTNAQKQAIIVALLYKAGALDKDLKVQPLATWL